MPLHEAVGPEPGNRIARMSFTPPVRMRILQELQIRGRVNSLERCHAEIAWFNNVPGMTRLQGLENDIDALRVFKRGHQLPRMELGRRVVVSIVA